MSMLGRTTGDAYLTVTSSSQSTAIAAGNWLMISDVDCFISIGAGTQTAAAATAGSLFLPASTYVEVLVQGSTEELGRIRGGSTDGGLWAHKLR